ncbi:UDP-N-acetylglucosamine 2-epimerase (non-hydrolyzing) [Dolichospermum circinale CS-545/17]|nr:UDP-N-acetylglucosamine 2-epimerase (non-hydrolyzing) [Dolichospermum circinale CS-545/17]
MTNQHRIGIILGTRPEAIKLAPVIQVFRRSLDFELQVILTGQHREMVEQVMKLFKLKADWNLEIMQRQQSLSEITCRSLQGLEALFQEQTLDFVIVQGDTTTAFAATLAAFYQKIPVGHVEAGLRSDDLFNPFPEEANRRLISQLTQLHFAPTNLAVENLQSSGVLGEIHLTGNTVIDALLNVAATKPVCHIPGLDWHQYRTILATVHRRENWGEPLQDIAESFLQILEQFPDTALLLPLHKNPIVREPLQKLLGNHPRIFLTEPLDYAELVGAIERSHLILTDSGGLQEETPSLGKPVLVLRDTTERPEAVTAGTAKLVGTQTENIVAAASELLSNPAAYTKMATAINPFGDGHAAERILQLVKNYLSPQLNT